MKTARVIEILNVDGYTPRLAEKQLPHKNKDVKIVGFKGKEYMLFNLNRSNLKMFNDKCFDCLCYSIQEIKNYMKQQEVNDKFSTWSSLVDMSMRGV